MIESEIERTLTDHDISAITEALKRQDEHYCRFDTISPQDLAESVEFYKTANRKMTEDKTMVRQTLIKMGLYGGGAVFVLGITAWIVKAVAKGG